MTEIVNFPQRPINPGNGSLEKLKEYFGKDHNWPDHIPTMTEAEYFLAWLWMEGFKIVPAADEVDKLRYRLNYMEERYGRIDWDGRSVPNGDRTCE